MISQTGHFLRGIPSNSLKSETDYPDRPINVDVAFYKTQLSSFYGTTIAFQTKRNVFRVQ